MDKNKIINDVMKESTEFKDYVLGVLSGNYFVKDEEIKQFGMKEMIKQCNPMAGEDACAEGIIEKTIGWDEIKKRT